MGDRRVREMLAEHARRRAGLGPIVRVHRQCREPGVEVLLPAVFGGIGSALCEFGFVISHFWAWRLPILGYSAILLLSTLWVRYGPVEGRDGRRYFAVAEGGLVAWASGSAAPPTTIAWNDMLRVSTAPLVPATYWLIWSENGEEQRLKLPFAPGRMTLLRVLKQHKPVAPRRVPRLVLQGIVAVATALVLWFAALPVAADVILGQKPTSIDGFARMCQGKNAFGRAATYRGPGPHPLAVYDIDYMSFPEYTGGYAGAHDHWPVPGTVQLVGCVHLIGSGTDVISDCDYEGGYHLETHQGHYRVDVYEARTGRKVTSVNVDGDTHDDCSLVTYVNPDVTPKEQSYNTDPTDAGYAAALSSLMNGPAGGR